MRNGKSWFNPSQSIYRIMQGATKSPPVARLSILPAPCSIKLVCKLRPGHSIISKEAWGYWSRYCLWRLCFGGYSFVGALIWVFSRGLGLWGWFTLVRRPILRLLLCVGRIVSYIFRNLEIWGIRTSCFVGARLREWIPGQHMQDQPVQWHLQRSCSPSQYQVQWIQQRCRLHKLAVAENNVRERDNAQIPLPMNEKRKEAYLDNWGGIWNSTIPISIKYLEAGAS